mgnify:CR=1 FL=1
MAVAANSFAAPTLLVREAVLVGVGGKGDAVLADEGRHDGREGAQDLTRQMRQRQHANHFPCLSKSKHVEASANQIAPRERISQSDRAIRKRV